MQPNPAVRSPMKPQTCAKLDRRRFVRTATASTGAVLLSACGRGEPTSPPSRATSPPASTPPPQAPPYSGLPRETTLSLLDSMADTHMRMCHHCAQASFLTLREVFGLGGDAILKALTPIPGVAERGETCGAVIGSLMALGLVYGRDRLDDWSAWRACLIPARTFCEQFAQELGSTQCGEIQERLFGRRYNLMDPADRLEFQTAGATEKCGKVVRTAARIAGTLLLDTPAPTTKPARAPA